MKIHFSIFGDKEQIMKTIDLPLTFHMVSVQFGATCKEKGLMSTAAWLPKCCSRAKLNLGSCLWHPVTSCSILLQWKCRSNVFTKILASQLKAFDFEDLGRFWKYSVSGAVQQRSHRRPFLVFSLGDPAFQGEPGHKGPPALERGTPSLEVRWLRWPRWLRWLWINTYYSNTIFSGMNIHLPAILGFTRGTEFWPIPRWLKSCRHWSQQSTWHPVCSNSSRCRTLRLESCENSSPQL